MKRIAITLLFLTSWLVADAQKLITGVKAPELKVNEWLSSMPLMNGKPTLIEFFFSRSEPSQKRLPVLDDMARNYNKQLNVIVIGCETKEKLQSLLADKGYAFAVALDNEHKTFNAFDVQFVPYGVLLDTRGKVLWFGNSSKFDDTALRKTLDWK